MQTEPHRRYRPNSSELSEHRTTQFFFLIITALGITLRWLMPDGSELFGLPMLRLIERACLNVIDSAKRYSLGTVFSIFAT
jgi:hypothetical protein